MVKEAIACFECGDDGSTLPSRVRRIARDEYGYQHECVQERATLEAAADEIERLQKLIDAHHLLPKCEDMPPEAYAGIVLDDDAANTQGLTPERSAGC